MSTNYYLRILPTKSVKSKLKKAVDNNDFKTINDLQVYYNEIDQWDAKEAIEKKMYGIVHLGKRAGGWKFLWNPNTYLYTELVTTEHGEMVPVKKIKQLYKWTLPGIEKFIRSFGDRVYIVDEYHQDDPPRLTYNKDEEAEKVKDDKYLDLYEELGEWSVEGFMQMASHWGEQYNIDNQYSGDTYWFNRLPEEYNLILKKYPQAEFRDFDWWVNGLRLASTNDFS